MAATNSCAGTSSCRPRGLLWRAVLLSFIAALVAAVYSFMLPSRYSASATLLLAPMPIQQPEADNEGKVAETPATAVSFLMVKPLSVLDYRVLLMDDELVGKLRDEMKRQGSETGVDLADLKVEDVRQSMKVETRIMKQTIYDIVYQPVIQLRFSANDPELAAAIVNKWADLAVDLAGELSTKKKEGLIEFLRAQFEEKESELAAAEKELEALQSEWDTEALDERMRKYESFVSEIRTGLSTLASDIARSEGQLAELTKQLAGLPGKETLRRALPDDAYWLMQGTGTSPDSSKVLETEEINPLYVSLRQQEATLQSSLEGMLKEQSAKTAERGRLESEAAELRKTLAAQTRLLNAATRKFENLKIQDTQLAVNYGAAQIAEAERTPDLKCVSRAIPPERAAGPHRMLLILVALGLGALIAPTYYLLRTSLRPFVGTRGADPPAQTRA